MTEVYIPSDIKTEKSILGLAIIHEELVNILLEKIKANSDITITELTEEEREVFRQAAQPVRDEFLDSVGEKGAEILRIMEEDSLRIINE